VVGRFLCPSGAGKENIRRFHGLRCARESAGCAPPVATARGPSGAESRPVGAKKRAEPHHRIPSEDSGCEPGRKCRLQIDHVVPISQGGTDDEHNLRAVCVYYNKDKANLKVPTSRDAISVMALIRRQPRDVQMEVHDFLAKKFGKKSGGM